MLLLMSFFDTIFLIYVVSCCLVRVWCLVVSVSDFCCLCCFCNFGRFLLNDVSWLALVVVMCCVVCVVLGLLHVCTQHRILFCLCS